MSLYLRCPRCNKSLGVPNHALGRKILCPVCQSRFLMEPQLMRAPVRANTQPPTASTPTVDIAQPQPSVPSDSEEAAFEIENAIPERVARKPSRPVAKTGWFGWLFGSKKNRKDRRQE
jgi:DNA-directed RNA polymerase subunit RPC12/RpoP